MMKNRPFLIFLLVISILVVVEVRAPTSATPPYQCAEYTNVDMLVGLDHSSSMYGDKIVQASNFAADLFIGIYNTGYLDKRGAFRFCGLVPLPGEYSGMGYWDIEFFPEDFILVAEGGEGVCYGDWDGTALYDAIRFGADELTYSTSNIRVLVIITDGYEDGQSQGTLNDAAKAINRHGLVTELIFVGSGSTELNEIARLGGPNAHYRYASASQLSGLIQNVIADTCKNYRPNARMTISDTELRLGIEGHEIFFDGSSSSDYETSNTNLNFEWVYTGPDGVTFTLRDEAINGEFSDTHIGIWHVWLKVTDPSGASDTTETQRFRVIGSPPNVVVEGGGIIDALNTITLHASANDPDGGSISSFEWRVVDAPAGGSFPVDHTWDTQDVSFVTAEKDITLIGTNDIGTWIFECTATDNERETATSEHVRIEVRNLPPKLSLVEGEDIDVGEIILIDATDSWDPDGGDLTFQWDILQAPVDAPLDAGDGFSTSYIEIQTDESYAGTWIFQLTVTDNEGESVESEEFAVLVDAPPTAVITGPTEPISSFSELVLDGSDSVDPDSPCPDRPDLNYCHETIAGRPAKVSHGIVDYCWLLIDVPPELWDDYPTGRVDEVFEVAADSPTLTLEPGTLETGDWAFELMVRDDEGNEDRTTFAVAVVDPNSPPTAVLNAPARYTTDISGILSQDITLSGFLSYDLDNVFDEELKPGVGITDYQWSIVEAPTGCTPHALPSGETAHTVNLYTAGESVEPACQGFWQIRLTVTDDDSPAMTGCAETSVIIGNCPQPLCIDYPTALNPQFVEFTEDTDIFIYYHLDSALYEDAAFSFSMFSMLEIFHESDLTTPVYTSIDPNVLASDKGGYLVFHWDGYTADTFACPPPGFYTVQITLLDDMLGVTTSVARESNAIWIAVAKPCILDTSDKCIKHDELDRGADRVTINYEITPSILPDELHWRVRDASDTVIFESIMPLALSGTIEWNGQVGGATIPPGSYTVEIEAFGGVFSLGVSDPHEFMVYKNVPPYQIHVTGFVGDVITVDMSETDLNIFRFESSQVSNNPAFPANHNFPANEFGYVAKIDNWETNLSNSGVFYFVPTAAETSELRLAAEDNQRGVSTCISCVIEVQDGYSTAGPNRVTFGSRRLDIYRQQQRLRYFRFPDRNGNNLTVDGLMGDRTRWAIGLFNHAVNDANPGDCRNINPQCNYRDPNHPLRNRDFPLNSFTNLGEDFINARNAPRWVELPAGGRGWTNDDGAEDHDWGTSWATRVVERAGAANNAGHLIRTNDLSLRAGGDTLDHRSHEAGMDIDVRLVSPGLWYNIGTVVANLNSGSNFWNTVRDALPNDNIASSAQARAGVAVGGNFNANYAGNNGWRIDRTIINLYDHRRTGDAYDFAIQSLAPGGFDRGFDVLIPLRAGYDRTATVEQIAAFSNLSVSRVHYNDPVALRLLQARPVSFRLTPAATHSHHFHVDVECPPIQWRPPI